MEERVLKERIRDSWNEFICYPEGVTPAKLGTKRFFEDIERIRYTDHAYLLKIAGFNKYANKKVLEVGCGIGTDLSQFAKHGAIVTGTDLTSSAVELAKKRFKFFGLKGDFRVADTEALPFKDGEFDLVYAFGVLHHTPDTEKAIAEIFRVLKPGGKIFAMLYYKNLFTYYVKLLLFRWILSGKFLFLPFEKIRNELEYKGCPLTRLFSKREARILFRKFRQVKMQSFYIHKDNVPLIGWLLPQRFCDLVARRFGFHLIIEANK